MKGRPRFAGRGKAAGASCSGAADNTEAALRNGRSGSADTLSGERNDAVVPLRVMEGPALFGPSNGLRLPLVP